ncbi:MAG: DUF1659 domain-containing protein [Peptococcaceae bacterium]|nr:DUF1659 domain-containing protein [Peptococcaceae bacterium]
MAINAVPLNSAIVVKYQAGESSTGSPIIRQKTINDIKFDAGDQDVYDVVSALFSLSIYPVVQNILRKNYDLIEE